jgi:hypothetical protein
MSIVTHVSTPESQPIAIPELTTDMATAQMAARVLRDFRDWSQFDVVESGKFRDGDILCGWVTSGPVASEIAAAVTRQDRQGIERYLLEGNLGACGVGIRDLAGVTPEDRVGLTEVDGDESFADVMERSRFDYDAYSPAGRNELSILMQFRLAQVIAKQRGGVWTDPVSGDYLVVAKGRWERLPCLVATEEQNA